MKSIQILTCPVCKAKLKVIVEAQMREDKSGVAIEKGTQKFEAVEEASYVPMIPNIGYMTSLFPLVTTSRGTLWSNGAIVLMFQPPWVFDIVPEPLYAKNQGADEFLSDILLGLKTASQLHIFEASGTFVYMKTKNDEDRKLMCNRSFLDVFYFVYGDTLRFFVSNNKEVSESPIYVVSKTTLVGFFMPISEGGKDDKAPIQES